MMAHTRGAPIAAGLPIAPVRSAPPPRSHGRRRHGRRYNSHRDALQVKPAASIWSEAA